MRRTLRVASTGVAFAIALACGGTSPPPTPESVPASPPVDGDPDLTLNRCELTAWSYSGCEQAFPAEGRAWLERTCADATAEYRTFSCVRWSEYRVRGVGGPHELEAGFAELKRLCATDGEERRLACYVLASELVYVDLAAATEAYDLGCDAPSDSPGGCGDLRTMLEMVQTTSLQVRTATGAVTATPGATCVIAVAWYAADRCQGRVTCADVAVYGGAGSQFPCRFDGERIVRGGEAMTTSTDGDPAMEFDVVAGTLTVSDDAPGATFALTAAAP